MVAFRRLGWSFALTAPPRGRGGWAGPWCSWSRCASATAGPAAASTASCSTAWPGTPERLAGSEVLYPLRGAGAGGGAGTPRGAGEAGLCRGDGRLSAFFLPRMVAAAAARLPVLLEAVDSNGLLPLRAADQDFITAYHFRRFLQKSCRGTWSIPGGGPSGRAAAARVCRRCRAELPTRWPGGLDRAARRRRGLRGVAIDHRPPVAALRGGEAAAERALDRFLDDRLATMAKGGTPRRRRDERPLALPPLRAPLDAPGFRRPGRPRALDAATGWRGPPGAREGWWGMSAAAEKFLDEVVTWREVGFNMVAHREDYDRFDSLPAMGAGDPRQHAEDPRPHLYSRQASTPARPRTSCGTPPRRSSRRRGASTTTCGCCGARRSSNGPPRPRTRWRS